MCALTAVAVLAGACTSDPPDDRTPATASASASSGESTGSASDGSDTSSGEDGAASEILPGATPGPTSLGEAGLVLTIRVRVGGGAELSIARTLVTTG